jgi:hypothetical protein
MGSGSEPAFEIRLNAGEVESVGTYSSHFSSTQP